MLVHARIVCAPKRQESARQGQRGLKKEAGKAGKGGRRDIYRERERASERAEGKENANPSLLVVARGCAWPGAVKEGMGPKKSDCMSSERQ